MKIGLISSSVPHVRGGYRFIVDWLHEALVERGHDVETVYLPFSDELDSILPQMVAYRLIDLESHFDRVITFRPPAHVVKHSCKVVFFIHHLRIFYDLWDTVYCPPSVKDTAQGHALRSAIKEVDDRALGEAYRVFANSRAVSERIRRFNGVASEVLYPPVRQANRFRAGAYGDEIVAISRMERHKRQHLLVQAMGLTQTPVRLRLSGKTSDPSYAAALRDAAESTGRADRIIIEDRWISEDEKIGYLESALASAYLPFDEDSYGYPTIEAAHARRCTITALDAGGVLEFVSESNVGVVVKPQPHAIAAAFDSLYMDRALAERLGTGAEMQIKNLCIDWDTTVTKLLS